MFDVRVLFSEPSCATWYGATTKDNAGGYEIRLKDWEGALQRARNSNRAEWEARTIYMVSYTLFDFGQQLTNFQTGRYTIAVPFNTRHISIHEYDVTS